MALARKEEFLSTEIVISDLAKALSHPARVAILKTLAEKGECVCGDLVVNLPLAQSTVSQHLKALKKLGLIRGTIDGTRSRYCIDWKVFEKHQKQLDNWTHSLLKLKQLNCC